MAFSKIDTNGLALDSVDNTILDLSSNFAFSGTITGIGGSELVVQAKNNSSQTLSDNTTTKLTVDTELVDTESKFDPSNSRYTPANGHYVMFIEYMGYPAGSTARGFSFKVYKNGSEVFASNMYSNSSAHYFGNSDNNGKTITYYFEQTTATDYYEWYLYNNTNSVNWNSSSIRVTIFKK